MTFTPIAATHHHPRRAAHLDGFWCKACGVAWPCDAYYAASAPLTRDKREVAALLDFDDDELADDPFPEPDLGRDHR